MSSNEEDDARPTEVTSTANEQVAASELSNPEETAKETKATSAKIGNVEVPSNFFADDLARQFGPVEDKQEGNSEEEKKFKESLQIPTLASITLPSIAEPLHFLSEDKRCLALNSKAADGQPIKTTLGPEALFKVVNASYRSAEVMIDLKYKTQMIAYHLGTIHLSFSGLVDGAKPLAGKVDVKEDETIDSDEIWFCHLPMKCGSVHITLSQPACIELISKVPEAAGPVLSLFEIYGKLQVSHKTHSDEPAIITCRFGNTSFAADIAERIGQGYSHESDLHSIYTELFSKAPKSRLLTKDRFATLTDERPEPPMVLFHTPMNRKISLGYSTYLDHQHQVQQAELLAGKVLNAVAFRLPNMSKNKVQVGHIFAIRDTKCLGLIPSIGSSVQIEVQLKHTMKAADKKDIPIDEQRRRAVDHVHEGIKNLKGQARPLYYLAKYVDQIVKPASTKGKGDRDKVVMALSMLFLEGEPKFIKQDAGDDQPIPEETPREQLDRVADYIQTDKHWDKFFRMPDTSAFDGFLKWSGQRIAVPEALSGLAGPVFYAELPLHPKWPKGVPNWPRVDYPDLQLIDLQETLQATVAKLDLKKQFKVRIEQKLSDRTLDTRLEGISKFDSEPAIEMLSRWHLNLEPEQPLQDFFQFFPFAAKVLAAFDTGNETNDDDVKTFVKRLKSLDADQLAAFRALKVTPGGVWILQGCPGSGKTRLCLLILALASWSLVDEKLLVRPEPVIEVTPPSDFHDANSKQDSTQDDAPPANDTDVGSNQEERSTQNDASAAKHTHGSDNDDAANYVLDSTDGWDVPDLTSVANAAQDEPKLISPQILIIVGRNSQGDDVATQVDQLCGGKVMVTRTNTMIKEDKRVSKTGLPAPPGFDTPIFDLINMTEALVALEELSSQVKADKAKSRLHGGNLVLGERVKMRIATDPEYAELAEWYASRHANPDSFEANKAHFHTQAKDATAKCIRETGIMVCTPVAARSLKNHFPEDFRPVIILFEETGRLTEPDLMSAIALYPSAIFQVFSGDHLQLGPHVYSLPTNIFGEQLAQSLLERAVKAGFPILELNTNWRSHHGIEGLSSDMAYGGKMISAYLKDLKVPQADIVHRFIESIGQRGIKPKGNIFLYNVKGDEEFQEGTSYSNAAHAAVAADLVSRLFRYGVCSELPTATIDGKRARILVMSPYKSQTTRLQWAIGGLSKTEYCPSLVDVRTVDTAMGDTCDIAILDLTRSAKCGFTKDIPLLNVGVSRAKYGLFVIGNGNLMKKSAGLSNIWSWCDDSDAIFPIFEGKLPGTCRTCYGASHGTRNGRDEACRAVLKCENCGQCHHARNCRAKLQNPMSETLTLRECVGLNLREEQEDSAAHKVQEGQVQQAPTAAQRRDQIAAGFASSFKDFSLAMDDVEIQRILIEGFKAKSIKDTSHDAEATSKGKGKVGKNNKTTEQPKQDDKHPKQDDKHPKQDDNDSCPSTETGWGAFVGRDMNIDDFPVYDSSVPMVLGGPSLNSPEEEGGSDHSSSD